ncbi:MAG: hypothetical protein KatS3mg131_1262 [Candidatus Tectimicrobiota bacterium]|nr:MAG: hypothetical protein KatS3mg131_1262 [Candidatus Tectomicrobia bacterium]
MTPSARLAHYLPLLRTVQPIRSRGTVCRVRGLLIVGQGPAAALGDVCEIYPRCRNVPVRAEVVGFAQHEIMLMPLGELRGIRPGSPILHRGERAAVPVGLALQGRVLDGLGQPLDERGPLAAETTYPLYAQPLHPLRRARISEPLDLGVRAINALLTCGKGQRLGIFAGSGVGKSALLGMIARATQADINVIALIGERGREVREFLERDLGPAGQQRSVVVVATAEQPPLVRLRAAFVATAIAEFFRDRGQDVLLMMDSLTRVAMAQREIGLAVGEPPTSRGYTPSVFTLLPQLLERAGMGAGQGSITGLYTVLIEGDDFHDPIGDAVRATVDGHLLLSRALGSPGPLSGHRRAPEPEPGHARHHHGRAPAAGGHGARAARRLPGRRRLAPHRGLCAGQQPPARPGRENDRRDPQLPAPAP